MLGIILALISGALMSIQGVFNTAVTKASSVWVAAGFVQLTAFLTCIAAWFFTGREPILAFWQTEPKYMLLGGVIGAFITFTVIRAMEGLGPQFPLKEKGRKPQTGTCHKIWFLIE